MDAPIDLALIDRIQKGQLKSITVIPPFITPWTTPEESVKKTPSRFPVGSMNLQESARKAGQREFAMG
jgi:hypothetical protein